MSATLATLLGLDSKLGAAGFTRLSPWWREQGARFYNSGATLWAARVGRGGSKSTTSVLVALNEVLFGDFVIPRGERHEWIHVSENVTEATRRLGLFSAYLDALRIRYERRTDAIDLLDMPRTIRVLACRVGAVSGPRAFGWTADEAAKWRNADDSANPAKEVIASMNAMTITHPTARRLIFSSPVSSGDYHFEVVERGDRADQVVSIAPSWIANPSITEAQTHALEPDDRVWRREYLAEPQASQLAAFDREAVDRAFAPRTNIGTPQKRAIVVDPSSGRSDSWTWGVVGWNAIEGGAVLTFDVVDGVHGSFWRTLSGAEVVARVATLAKARGVNVVHGDQREALMLASEFARHGIAYRSHAWTSANKSQAVERVRRLLAEGLLSLPDHDKLRRELYAFEERITPSGAFTSGGRSGKDDYVALLITAVIAEVEGELSARLGPSRWPSNDRERMRRAATVMGFEPESTGDERETLRRYY